MLYETVQQAILGTFDINLHEDAFSRARRKDFIKRQEERITRVDSDEFLDVCSMVSKKPLVRNQPTQAIESNGVFKKLDEDPLYPELIVDRCVIDGDGNIIDANKALLETPVVFLSPQTDTSRSASCRTNRRSLYASPSGFRGQLLYYY